MGISGIYSITNTINGKKYIGSAININRRWSEHRKFLRKGNHKNNHLQSSWNKHGECCFLFEIIEDVPDASLLLNKEQYWIDYFKELIDIYNLNMIANSFYGRHHSDETKKKISETKKAQKRKTCHSPEARKAISEATRGKKRQPLSKEHRAKISASSTRHSPSEKTIKAIKKKNSIEFCLLSPNNDVVQGANVTEFSKQHGLTRQAICAVLLGKRKQHKGWTKYNAR
jgi:group I intron endonuclease